MSAAPVIDLRTFVLDHVGRPEDIMQELSDELAWERRDGAPRSEFYANDHPVPYTYGRGVGERIYHPQPWHAAMLDIRKSLESELLALIGWLAGRHLTLDVCFNNRYSDARDWLGWHADGSPEMCDHCPIVTVSFGARRQIAFRPNNNPKAKELLWLETGSVAVMLPGMQDEWQHSIPKAGHVAGERISLTFRHYTTGATADHLADMDAPS